MAAKITRGAALSDINVTPLVDVMLVLLVIFMVTAPLLEQQQNQAVHVDLPKVVAQNVRVAEEAVVITVDRDNQVFVNDHPHALADLQPLLTTLFKGRANKEIFLRADRAVPYGRVVETMALIRAAGVTRLNMVTEPLENHSSTRRRR